MHAYCYTVKRYLHAIREHGILPAQWLSINPTWDASAAAVFKDGSLATMVETAEWGEGLIRLIVPLGRVPVLYRQWRLTASHQATSLAKKAIEAGANADEWRFTRRQIQLVDVIAIEQWDREAWTSLKEDHP
jgi:hypothetical protein